MPDTTAFPVRLKRLRAAAGWTQEQLARQAGTSARAVTMWERGQRAPGLPALRALAAALRVSLDELAGG